MIRAVMYLGVWRVVCHERLNTWLQNPWRDLRTRCLRVYSVWVYTNGGHCPKSVSSNRFYCLVS